MGLGRKNQPCKETLHHHRALQRSWNFEGGKWTQVMIGNQKESALRAPHHARSSMTSKMTFRKLTSTRSDWFKMNPRAPCEPPAAVDSQLALRGGGLSDRYNSLKVCWEAAELLWTLREFALHRLVTLSRNYGRHTSCLCVLNFLLTAYFRVTYSWLAIPRVLTCNKVAAQGRITSCQSSTGTFGGQWQ